VVIYVVERYWPGVSTPDVDVLAERLRCAAVRLAAAGESVRYLGSLLIVGDDVVQCRFESVDTNAVVRLNEQADARFDRILEARAYPA
jgi:hypothetical protein